MKLFRMFETKAKADDVTSSAATLPGDNSLFKAFITEGIYKPPFGYPRPLNTQLIRQLAKTAYIHSIVQTLTDEIATTKWDIKVKEHAAELGAEEPTEQIAKVKEFFLNPNGNEESWEHISRMLVADILELDAGVLVKVYNEKQELKQLFARDGASFLKNPDIFGYYGNRADVIPQYTYQYDTETRTYKQDLKFKTLDDVALVKEQAAYFQYGWTPGSVPVPFGKKEVVYISRNPRTDSVYGRAPIEMIGEILYTLIYGSSYNLDFYTNNNMPEGILSLIGANQTHIDSVRERMDNQIRFKDNLGKWRKKFFKVPITNTDVKFTPFQLLSKDLEVLQQQQWFVKFAWACFGINAEELGFTEDSNKAVSQTQSKVGIRKGIRPLLKILEYHINTQIMPDLDPSGVLEFCYDEYDPDMELKQLAVYQAKSQLGVMTPEMIAEELGVDVDRLKAEKEEQRQKDMELMGGDPSSGSSADGEWLPVSERKKQDPEQKDVEVKYKYIKRTGQTGNYEYQYARPKVGRQTLSVEKQKLKWIDAVLHNDETSSNAELVDYFMKEGEMSKKEAQYYAKQRYDLQTRPEWHVDAYDEAEQRDIKKAQQRGKMATAAIAAQYEYVMGRDGKTRKVRKADFPDPINETGAWIDRMQREGLDEGLILSEIEDVLGVTTSDAQAILEAHSNKQKRKVEKKNLPEKEEDFPVLDEHFDEARKFIDEEVERLFNRPLETIR